MPRRILIATAALFGAHLAWAARLVAGPSPVGTTGAALIAADLVLLGVITSVGVLLGRTPWTRRLALGALAGHGVLAVVFTIDALWIGAASLSALAGLGLAPTPSGRWFASPPGQAVPGRATALALGLLAGPAVIGATGWEHVTIVGIVTALLAPAVGFAYARAKLGALWVARLLVPVLFAGSAIGLRWPGAVALAGAGAALTALAWTVDARNAASPLVRRQTTVPILPEMVPAEILDAAGFDSRGRPKGDR